MAQDFYIQPDAPDPVLEAETVLRIVRQHAPTARSVRAVDENGGEARVYAIDDDLILKVQRPQQVRPRTSLVKERFFLESLSSVPGVRVPRVLGGGGVAPDIEYTLLTRMPGVAIEMADLSRELRRRALTDLGRMLRRIHAIPQSALFDSRLIPGDHTPAEVRWRFGHLFADAIEAIARGEGAWGFALSPTRVMRSAMRTLPEVRLYVALHSNPGPEHVFVHQPSGQLSGIIDFGDAYFSHPAHDLRRFRCPDDRAAIFAGYTSEAPVSEEFARTWDVACVLADMLATIHDPECRDAAQRELATLIKRMQ